MDSHKPAGLQPLSLPFFSKPIADIRELHISKYTYSKQASVSKQGCYNINKVTLCHMYLGGQQAGITASQCNQEELGQKDNQRDSSVPWGHTAVRSPAVCRMEMGRRALSCAQHVGQCRLHSSTISLPGEGRLFCSANISLLK